MRRLRGHLVRTLGTNLDRAGPRPFVGRRIDRGHRVEIGRRFLDDLVDKLMHIGIDRADQHERGIGFFRAVYVVTDQACQFAAGGVTRWRLPGNRHLVKIVRARYRRYVVRGAWRQFIGQDLGADAAGKFAQQAVFADGLYSVKEGLAPGEIRVYIGRLPGGKSRALDAGQLLEAIVGPGRAPDIVTQQIEIFDTAPGDRDLLDLADGAQIGWHLQTARLRLLRGRQRTAIARLVEGHNPIGVDSKRLEPAIDKFLYIARQRVDSDKTGVVFGTKNHEARQPRQFGTIAIDPRYGPAHNNPVICVFDGDGGEVERRLGRHHILKDRCTDEIGTLADQAHRIHRRNAIEEGGAGHVERVDQGRLTGGDLQGRIAIARHELVDAIGLASPIDPVAR